MCNNIKSLDLCRRCTYGICPVEECGECENRTELEGRDFCKCDTVRENTPCQYFVEDEDLG